jgi:flagellar L-ring protein precursor FlgH
VRRRALAAALPALAAVLLGGCARWSPRVEVADTTPPVAAALVAPAGAAPTGSIFQSASYRPMFEDYRARLVGDTLTVQIVENVSASATSTSSLAKTGTVSASVTALPGLLPSAFGRATAAGTSNNTFSGNGATVNNNAFTGTITVVVRQVLPNGVMVVTGEKQIGVNENVDVLRFSGQVDPRAILPGNTVPSGQIANVRLEQRSRGQQGEAQAMGWLSRIFLNVLPI